MRTEIREDEIHGREKEGGRKGEKGEGARQRERERGRGPIQGPIEGGQWRRWRPLPTLPLPSLTEALSFSLAPTLPASLAASPAALPAGLGGVPGDMASLPETHGEQFFLAQSPDKNCIVQIRGGTTCRRPPHSKSVRELSPRIRIP